MSIILINHKYNLLDQMEKIKQLLSSYKTTLVLLLIYALMMAIGTFIEESMNTTAAKVIIYYSPSFIFVQLLLIVNFLFALVQRRFVQDKRWGMIILHMALVVILIGAMVTHVWGKEGTVHIREGEKNDTMVIHTSKGTFEEKLPFTLELVDFHLIRYPGSNSPSSYESDLKIHVDNDIIETKVFMNNVFDIKGYRLFQASYDEDELGTVLSVNQDVAGRNITYFGYGVLFIGFIMMFVMPNSRLWQLNRQLKKVQASIKATIMLLLITTTISAKDFSKHATFTSIERNVAPVEHAEKFGEIPVQLRGRVMPMNSFASEVLRKLHGETKVGSITPDQFIISLITMPEMWMQIEFLKLSNKDIIEKYNLQSNGVSYAQLFDERGNYRLLEGVEEVHKKDVKDRSKYDNDLLKLDEQINIMFLLINHQIPALFPDAEDPNHTWYASGDNLSGFPNEDSLFISRSYNFYISEATQSMKSNNWEQPEVVINTIKEYQIAKDAAKLIDSDKISAEVKYNKLDIFSKVRGSYFILGGLLLIISFIAMYNDKRWMRQISWVLIVGIIASFLFHMYGMGLRWSISGYAPWSNSYETMVYVSWVTALAGLVFTKRSHLTLSLAIVFSGVILFVSNLYWMNPEITTLVPVLKSPWLMIHVAVIVAAYGFFGVGFMLGLVNLLIIIFTDGNKKTQLRIRELNIINNMGLLIGLALLTIGTFMGGVWANESWGRYWSWDPKETWALITVVVYSVVIHLHLVGKWFNNWTFNFAAVISFATVLMTFLGVNFFLSGLHSYGKNDGVAEMFNYIGIGFVIILIIGIVSFVKHKRLK